MPKSIKIPMWISMVIVVFFLGKYGASTLAIVAAIVMVMWFFNIINRVRIKNKTK